MPRTWGLHEGRPAAGDDTRLLKDMAPRIRERSRPRTARGVHRYEGVPLGKRNHGGECTHDETLGRSQTAACVASRSWDRGVQDRPPSTIWEGRPHLDKAPRVRSSANLTPRERSGAFGLRAGDNSGEREIRRLLLGRIVPVTQGGMQARRERKGRTPCLCELSTHQWRCVTTLGAVTQHVPDPGEQLVCSRLEGLRKAGRIADGPGEPGERCQVYQGSASAYVTWM